MDFINVAKEVFPSLLKGLKVTVQVTVISLAIALALGLVMCLMGRSEFKPLSLISKFYIWIIRGTPFIVQLFIIYFGIPQLVQSMGGSLRLSSFEAAVITLSLNAGAYISEIFRGGIQAVDPGQTEAARSLGMTKMSCMLKVVLPQAFRISIPSLCNQFIITLKDTSLAQCIALAEIVYQGKMYVGRTMQSFNTYILIGMMYLFVITILSALIRFTEKRLDYGNKNQSKSA